MNIFLTLAALFFTGSLFGWTLEVFYRKFLAPGNREHRWINPGFLTGPYLPLYGFGLTGMYLLCSLKLPFVSGWREIVVRILLITLVMTGIEYVAGRIFVVGLHIKLWDYSKRWGNIQGIICPLFSLFWGILGAFYYLVVHSHIQGGLDWLSENLAYSFFIGMFFGILVIDLSYSLQIVAKVRKVADEYQVVVRYEELKSHIRENREQAREKARFLLAFRTERPLSEHLREYMESMRKKGEKIHLTVEKKKRK
jgi:uncharacterized membrane protein